MKAKVVFEDKGDNVIISTEGAMADKGTEHKMQLWQYIINLCGKQEL